MSRPAGFVSWRSSFLYVGFGRSGLSKHTLLARVTARLHKSLVKREYMSGNGSWLRFGGGLSSRLPTLNSGQAKNGRRAFAHAERHPFHLGPAARRLDIARRAAAAEPAHSRQHDEPGRQLFSALLRQMSQENETAVFIDDDQRARLLGACFEAYYATSIPKSWCSTPTGCGPPNCRRWSGCFPRYE